MATEIARTQDNLGSRLINTQLTNAVDASFGVETLSSIGASVNRSTETLERSNASILKVVSSLGSNKNKYTPITTELRRIASTLGFISGKQLPLIAEFMAKDNTQSMRAYDLESKAFKKQNKMSKSAARMRREQAIEDGTSGSNDQQGADGEPDQEVKSKLGIFGRLKKGLLGGLIMFKGLALNVLKIFGKAGVIGAVVLIIKGLYEKFQAGEFDERLKALGVKWDSLMITLTPIIEAVSTIFSTIGDHLTSFIGDALISVTSGIMDVVGGLGKLLSGDLSGGLKQMIIGEDGKGGIINMLGNVVLDAFSALGGILDDLGITEAFNTWLKGIIRPMLPERDSLLAWAVPEALYEYVDAPPAVVQSKQDKAIQNDAASLMETPTKSSVRVKKFRTKQEVLQKKYLGVTMSKPPQDAPAMEATKNNAQIKQDAENLKEQSKQIQVNAPQVMNDNSAQTINNLAAESPTKPAAWGRR
jgi:hypothetical protein